MPRRKKVKTSKKTRKSYSRKKKRRSTYRQSLFNVIKFFLLLGTFLFIVYYFGLKPFLGTEQGSSLNQILNTEAEEDLGTLSKEELFDYRLNQLLAEYEFLDSWIKRGKNSIQIKMPGDFPSIVLIHKIISLSKELGYDLLTSTEDLVTNRSVLEIGTDKDLVRKIVFKHAANLKRNRGKIAIIIDDFGYSENDDIKRILSFPHKLTFAIIPGLQKSKVLYEQALLNNKETLIHIPMEAVEQQVEYSDYTIFTNMTDNEITRRVNQAINEFPSSKGINNHMGSKVTSNEQTMEIIVKELKKNNKFLIDSKTTKNTVAVKTAIKFQLPCAARDVFLERKRNDSKEYLKKMLVVTAKIAEKTGSAIAIGHPYKNTVDVLIEEIPKMERQGFDFVTVSELANK